MTNTDYWEPQEGRGSLRAEERHRLALELHDTVGQALALANLHLVRMQQKLREPLNADTRSWFQHTVDALLAEIALAIHSVEAEIFTLRQALPIRAAFFSHNAQSTNHLFLSCCLMHANTSCPLIEEDGIGSWTRV